MSSRHTRKTALVRLQCSSSASAVSASSSTASAVSAAAPTSGSSSGNRRTRKASTLDQSDEDYEEVDHDNQGTKPPSKKAKVADQAQPVKKIVRKHKYHVDPATYQQPHEVKIMKPIQAERRVGTVAEALKLRAARSKDLLHKLASPDEASALPRPRSPPLRVKGQLFQSVETVLEPGQESPHGRQQRRPKNP